jgi:hypothetical protein
MGVQSFFFLNLFLLFLSNENEHHIYLNNLENFKLMFPEKKKQKETSFSIVYLYFAAIVRMNARIHKSLCLW